ncbi:hypothetical protein HYV98_00300 [Candidatus Azambacteria bacterium]|nr:hypothetical protein [Candidatus Azambacteria bacterium]
MKFSLLHQKETARNLLRRAEYHEQMDWNTRQLSYIRSLGGGAFPRFHLYVTREVSGKEIELNLHLDQKRPSYEGSHAHAGEYEGDLVEQEAERIRRVLGV